MITGFHAHIYFTADTRDSAEKLRARLGIEFGAKLRPWGHLIDHTAHALWLGVQLKLDLSRF